jgi:hypothetical protein
MLILGQRGIYSLGEDEGADGAGSELKGAGARLLDWVTPGGGTRLAVDANDVSKEVAHEVDIVDLVRQGSVSAEQRSRLLRNDSSRG